MNYKNIKTLTPENFKNYGTIIEFTAKMDDGWEILVKSDSPGWRIALLEFSRKATRILENHPTSKESFEPVSGMALLIVAENQSPENFEIFLLDKPICLDEGVWHQVISLSEMTKVKITENLEVTCEYHSLSNEIKPVVLV